MDESLRRSFFIQTLRDAKRELQSLDDTGELINSLLLTAIGTLGITSGFMLLIDNQSHEIKTAFRGIEQSEMNAFLNTVNQSHEFQNFQTLHPSLIAVKQIQKTDIIEPVLIPNAAIILFQWFVHDAYAGFAGFGEKIQGDSYQSEDMDFFQHLFNSFMVSLNNAHYRTVIQKMTTEIGRKQREVDTLALHGEYIQKELERRLFHLQSLYDLSKDLAELRNTDLIRDTFLLTALGIFSVEQALIQIVNPVNKSTKLSCRGIDKDNIRRISIEEFETLWAHHLDKADKSKPLTTYPINDTKHFQNTISQLLPMAGMFFCINENAIGIIALGMKITGNKFTDEDMHLLSTLLHTFMIFMEHAQSFEKIQNLNLELEKQNIELNQAFSELTNSQQQVELLEKAKERVKSFVQHEKQKFVRLSLIDILIILCFGTILGIIYNAASPGGISVIPKTLFQESLPPISISLAKLKYDQNTALFIDARPAEFFKQKHIPKAVNLPFPIFDFIYMMKFSELDSEKPIIVYGRNISRRYDDEVAAKLISRGHANVKVMMEGISVWEAKGFPTEP